MSNEYLALVAKVETFTGATSERRRSDMACRAGCAVCCHAWLTLSPVEADQLRLALAALPGHVRARVKRRGARELARQAHGAADPRCALLEDDGTCASYAQRPLVCRTQGHALRYPEGFIPEQAVRARSAKGAITWCPLNYTESSPQAADVLDAERVDQLLAVVNHRFASAAHADPAQRIALSQLAAEVVLASAGDSDE